MLYDHKLSFYSNSVKKNFLWTT